jgi:hypothetical protein
VVILLILAAFIFIETPGGQNWLAKQFTKKFSRELRTKISFKHARFSLFNKLNIEEFMMEDQVHDTLIYAGNLQVRITDWFFLKDTAEIKYLGLENAVIKLQKSDTLWNYQFLVNYFTPTSKTPKKKAGIEFNLKKLSLKNVVLSQKDPSRGQDLIAAVGTLDMDANQISAAGKNIDINSITLTQPLFSLYTYPAKGQSAEKKDTIIAIPLAVMDTLLKWNKGGWTMNIGSIKIDNGVFKNIKQSDKPSLSYFDPKDMDFTAINGQFNNVQFDKDTFSAKVNMSSKERSGFIVKSLKSDIKVNPEGMFFNNLNLRTNNSIIKNYFALTYDDMADMADFIHKVRMQANFDDSQIDSDDLAYFAPAIKSWKKNIAISGKLRGTVNDISGNDLVINAGNSTYINGDLTLSGLPDINQTFIDFKSNDTRTNYADVVRFVPAARGITNPDLASLGNIHFTGSFTGFMHDFVTFGTIRTNLGTITSDLNMKLPRGKQPIYSGNIATTGFQLGRFIHNSKIGLISFSGVIKGHGSTINTLGIDLKANIREFDFNGYRYHNIVTNGKLEKQLFNGFVSINDSNLQATLNGLVKINGPQSKFDLVADVQTANLQPLKFTNENIYFNGKFNLNFTGNNIDNFLGVARISQANLVRNNQRLAFDSLVLHSDYANGIRTLTANSNEFDGSISGDFHIGDLPNAIQLFLNKYYPSYVKAPSYVITHQNFKFNLTTRQVNQVVQLIDPNLKGFNDSKIEGSLDLAQNNLELTAQVPQFIYHGQYAFNNTNIHAKGSLNQLSLNGNIQSITINDSINLPNTSFNVIAQNDSSKIKISTAANQAVTKADLNASVITYSDGVKINFDTSSFVLNSKTWTIDKGGELSFRKNTRASGEVVLRETNQEIKLRTIPSDEGSWNDLLVDLKDVNMGDIFPYFIPKARLEGLLSGSGKIENPGPKMSATGDFKTHFFRFNGDSIGELNISKISYDNQQDGNLKLTVTNSDPTHVIHAVANIYLKGNHDDNLIAVETKEYQLNFLESFLGAIFSEIEGYATGKMDIKGNLNALDYVGKLHLHNAGLRLKFTQVFYKLLDEDIELKEHELNLSEIKLLDTITNGTATLTGSIYHDSWKNMNFDLDVRVDGNPITLLNTTASDNTSFYGHAVGTGSMILVGSQNDLYMTVDAKSSENDSSHIIIPPAKSRSTGMADFLIERTHGHDIKDTLAVAANKLTFDIDLTADPHTTIEVILDEVTGDVVKAKGSGSLNIHSATGEPLTLNGNYDIEEGSYLFTFQSFFKRPFELRKGSSNYIKWNGDPNNAIIHFDAQYTAKDVSFAPLASLFGATNVQTTREDVNVIVTMSGELFQPKFEFKLDFPPGSVAINDPVLAFNLTQIENNPNEINKQVTYLIVFNSFAPIGGPNSSTASAATASGGITSAINELAYNTISSLLFNELNRQFSNILAQIFKDDKLKVILSGSVYNRNLIQQNSNNFNINTGNVNVTLSRALFNDRFIITAGSTLDIPLETTLQQKFQFLPDVSAEWLINSTGTIRATFFYRQNLDFLASTNTATTSTPTKTIRTGAGIAYRKEFDHIGELFRKKRDRKKQHQDNTTPASTSAPLQQPQEPKGSNQ